MIHTTMLGSASRGSRRSEMAWVRETVSTLVVMGPQPAPSPLAGEGWGGGSVFEAPLKRFARPPPRRRARARRRPSPQGGGWKKSLHPESIAPLLDHLGDALVDLLDCGPDGLHILGGDHA